MKASSVTSLVLALALSDTCTALRLPLFKQKRASFGRRAQITAPTNVSTPVALQDSGDTRYFANITVGGEDKTVLIDTGSTDLVIQGNVAGAVDTGVTAIVQYAAGTATGNILSGTVVFANHEIHHQAFLGTPADFFPSDGIMGVGLFTESSIELALNSSPGASPFLDNVFLSDPSTSNFISFLLQRNDDPDQNITAELTIGEIVPGYENVSSVPQVPVQAAAESGHWQILVDSVIGPDGNPVQFDSIVVGSPEAVAVLDTGAPFVLVPKAVSDAFYANVTGAVLDTTFFSGQQSVWVVDCATELHASFVIANTTYDIHPLDMTIPMTSDNGTNACIGAFVPNELDASFSFFDFLLGDPFLRNVYALLNYGDFVAGKTNETAQPFAQLLPLTNLDAAHKEFADARSNGTVKFAVSKDAAVNKDVTVNQIKQTASTAANKVKHVLIIVAATVGGLVLLGVALCLVCCCGFCGGRRRSFGLRGAETREVYRPLNAPAPMSHPDEYGYQGKGHY